MESVKAIVLNANQTPWKIGDYVHSYASQGVDCYRKLQNFVFSSTGSELKIK